MYSLVYKLFILDYEFPESSLQLFPDSRMQINVLDGCDE